MPSPETEFLFTDDFTAANWGEVMNPDARSDTLSPDRSSCVVPIRVNYSQYKSAVKFCLGYQWVDSGKNLRRSTPAFHPTYPWLYCAAITSVRFLGPNAANNFTSPFDFAVPAGGYTHAVITAEFRELLYNPWHDWEVDTEDERWVYQTRDPYTELAQIDGGMLRYYAPGVSGIDGTPIAAPHILAPLPKAKILLKWFQVPTEFVEDENGYSSKFKDALKCVNSSTFRSRRAGTLLLEQILLDKKPSPVATDSAGELKFTYDITFEFVEFDPPPGVTNSTYTYYGHNLMPGASATSASTAATGNVAFKYYYATDTGTVSGKPLFASYDFTKLFTHYSLV